jgi:hypothetical protein
MGFSSAAVTVIGQTLQFRSPAANGNVAVRNSCPVCGSLVFGGVVGVDDSLTLYAGALDDPALFTPRAAIFTHGRPDWAAVPAGLAVHERAPS